MVMVIAQPLGRYVRLIVDKEDRVSKFLHSRHSWAARFLVILIGVSLFAALNVSCTKKDKYSDELFYGDVAWGIMTGLVDILTTLTAPSFITKCCS